MSVVFISVCTDIADYAEQYSHILVPDERADYDELVEIDLSTVPTYIIIYMYALLVAW